MNTPLFWAPTLRLDRQSLSPAWAMRLADRFWQSHEGFGHVVLGPDLSPHGMTWTSPYSGSLAWRQPLPGQRFRSSERLPVRGESSAVEWEMYGLGDRAFARQLDPDCDRLIVIREPDMELEPLTEAVALLVEQFPTLSLWLDLPSWGWDAAAWLVRRFPHLQLDGVDDRDLAVLLQIAQWLGRPLFLMDWTAKPPRPIRELPGYFSPGNLDPAYPNGKRDDNVP